MSSHGNTLFDAIVFDFVGTLVRPKHCVGSVYAHLAREVGIEITAEEARQGFQDAFRLHGRKTYREWSRQDYEQSNGFGGEPAESLERLRWQTIVEHVFRPHTSHIVPSRLFESLWSHFAAPENWEIFADVEPIWEWLTQTAVRLVIATNFDQRFHAIRRAHELLSSCQHCFVSSAVGHVKPESEFYRAITDALCIPPARLLMVGDDFENDYLGARRCGWQALHLARTGASPAENAIRSLADLKDRLS